MSTLLDRVSLETVDAWYAEENDQIGGMVIGRSEFVGGKFEPYWIVTVRVTEEGSTETYEGKRSEIAVGQERAVHCFRTVLRNEIDRFNPQPGDMIAVKYFGQRQNRAGDNTYFAYRVVVEKDEDAEPGEVPELLDLPEAPKKSSAKKKGIDPDNMDIPF